MVDLGAWVEFQAGRISTLKNKEPEDCPLALFYFWQEMMMSYLNSGADRWVCARDLLW